MMQNFFTREDVLAYQQKGIKTIRVDQMPILTDLAREALQTFGMEIVTGAAAPAPRGPEKAAERPGPATGHPVGGGYGSSAFTPDTGGEVVGQKLTAPNLNKPAFRDLICSDKKLVGTFIGTPHPVITEFVGHFGFDFVCIDAEHNAIHLETVQKMLQSLKATPTYGMVRIPTLSYENVAGALDAGADALLIPQIRTMDDIRRLKEYSQYPPIGRRGSGPSRLWDYGDSITQLAAGRDMNRTTNVVVQLETVQAVEHIDEIVQSDFIDMFFIGPGDLAASYGEPAGSPATCPWIWAFSPSSPTPSSQTLLCCSGKRPPRRASAWAFSPGTLRRRKTGMPRALICALSTPSWLCSAPRWLASWISSGAHWRK